MTFAILGLLLVAWLPGAALFRAPVLERARREALDAEERGYWTVVLSLAWTSLVAFALAAAHRYSIDRLLLVNAIVTIAIVAGFRSRLRMPAAARPTLAAVVPLLLVAAGLWLFFPPAEYIVGGKDPGVYLNEGIQIGQRGALVTTDALVASVPASVRSLFFPPYNNPTYYSLRFMGFFVVDPSAGTVVGQFPHLFPVWIAIGYGLYGLTGALHVLGVLAILGLLGVYFLGARLLGRTAAAAAAALLAVSVVQVWFARYPNAEMLMQALVLPALLAFARSHVDDDPFFAPVSAVLVGLLFFARIEAVLVAGSLVGAALLVRSVGLRLRASFLSPLVLLGLLAFTYLVTIAAPYGQLPLAVALHPTWLHVAVFGGGIVAVVAVYVLCGIPAVAAFVRTWAPRALAVVVAAAAAYAFFLRQPHGTLAVHDASSLRTFTWYLHPAGLAAAVLGFVLVAWRRFWKDPGLLVTAAVSAFFVFYKLQIVPQHFWMARRFVALIMPAAVLFIAAAVFSGLDGRVLRGGGGGPFRVGGRVTRVAIRLAVLALLASTLLQSTRAILPHVEYAGVIPRLEALAKRFGDDDLVVVESRNASDMHVLALPLAYIYARNVLVLNNPKPDKALFAEFLGWARARYRGVYFIGGGGTDLLSRRYGVDVVGSDRFMVPEYESPRNAYPTGARRKEFDYGIYAFTPPAAQTTWFSLDVGTRDDLHVVRFHAKERNTKKSFRWTKDVSYVSVVGVPADASLLTIVMENGGRPASAGPATVEVSFDGHVLGTVAVGADPVPYSFLVPPDLARAAAASPDTSLLKLATRTWNPRATLGVDDPRDLGVMVDRIDLR
jgi:hypothetical protein